MTKELFELICFALGSFGAMCLIFTFIYSLKNIMKFMDYISADNNKKLIKDTIKEVEKPSGWSYQDFLNFQKYLEYTKIIDSKTK